MIFSASSSGISTPNSSSSAMTSSTVSRESAPRSSTKEAVSVPSSILTPSCSAIIARTRSWMDSAINVSSSFDVQSGLHGQAAVHHEDVPRDVPGGVADQKQRGLRDIPGFPEGSHRNQRLKPLLGLISQAIGHLGLDEPWGNRVARDPARGQLFRHRLGHADHPGLGRRVVRLTRIANEPYDGREDRKSKRLNSSHSSISY